MMHFMFKKANFFILLLLFAMPIVSGIIAFFLPIYQMEQSMLETAQRMKTVSFACQPHEQMKVQEWGQQGYARFCVLEDDTPEGMWQAWEESRLKIEGRYLKGDKVGRWLVYDENGDIYREMEYERGELVSDRIVAHNSGA